MKRALALALVAGQRRRDRDRGRPRERGAGKEQDFTLTGAGATFPYPLISKWIPAVGSAYGININYSPIGSGGGIAEVTARAVDIGASDAPLSRDQLDRLQGVRRDPVGARPPRGAVQPAGSRVRWGSLDGGDAGRTSIWARSRTGTTPTLEALNPKLTLPDKKITPVYRSDGSGTT